MTSLQSRSNRVIFRLFGALYRFVVETLARVRNQSIYCAPLAGHSPYHTAIASDMTVHCHCQDFTGEAILGDLRAQSFEDIWKGPVAESFRAKLAAGKFPLADCSKCGAWKLVPRGTLPMPKLPHSVMLENTVACNLKCTSCYREPLQLSRKRTTLTLDDVEIVSETLARLDVKHLHFLLLGEPFLIPEVKTHLEILRAKNPTMTIATSTNGTLLDTETKRRAAMLLDKVEFSIDGIDDESLTKYQRGGCFEKSFRNLKDLVKYRRENGGKTEIGWKYVLFRWNDKPAQLERALAKAREAGVDYLLFRATPTPVWGLSHRFLKHALFPMEVGGVRVSEHRGSFQYFKFSFNS